MSVLDASTITQPEKDWGVQLRNIHWNDFNSYTPFLVRIAVLSALTLATAFISFPFFWIGLSVTAIAIIASLTSLRKSLNKRFSDAKKEARDRADKWDREVLVPYLEAKYGIKIHPGEIWFTPTATLDDREITFKVVGIDRERDYRFGNHSLFSNYFVFNDAVTNYVFTGEVTIEEYVDSENYITRPLPTAAERM